MRKFFFYLNFVENVESRDKSDHFIQHQVKTANTRQMSVFQLNITNDVQTEQVAFRNEYTHTHNYQHLLEKSGGGE